MIPLLAAANLFVIVLTVGLFAMMGELKASLNDLNRRGSGESAELTPIEAAHLGRRPIYYPGHLGALTEGTRRVIVFGSSCRTCSELASGADVGSPLALASDLRVVVSAPSLVAGDRFIAASRALSQREDIFVDVEGSWLKEQTGVDISPAVLHFEEGVLTDARSFFSTPGLTAALS